MKNSSSSLRGKAFWSLFGTQFLGAFNDNFFRTAFITLLTYHFVSIPDASKAVFVSAAFGLFMTPFFLFSPLAGQLASHFNKSRIIQLVKAAEMLIVLLSSYGFIHQNPYFLLAALFCMGTHSAFYGPAKYALLPEILSANQLLKANGYVEAGTFLAIMGGTLTGALMIHLNTPPLTLSLQLFGVAALGFIVSLFLPPHRKLHPKKPLSFAWGREVKSFYVFTRQNPHALKAICGIAWFWLVGSLLMAQLPPLAKDVLKLQESVFILLLLLFTLGIGAGSLLCHHLFRGEITTKYTPLLSFLMAPFLLDLSTFHEPLSNIDLPLSLFVQNWQGLHLIACILCLSLIGGLFVVPLYTFLQAYVRPAHLSQVIAFNNIVMAGAMVFISFTSAALLSLGVSIPTLILLATIGQSGVTLYFLSTSSEPSASQDISFLNISRKS